jgi:hypothetical protein
MRYWELMATTALWLQMLGRWFLHLLTADEHLLKEARSKLSLGKIKPNGTSTTTLGCIKAARGEPTNAIR